jgi:cytochrome c
MNKLKISIGIIILSSSLLANNLTSCIACHGSNFEKSALGKSKIVKDMSKEEIEEILIGYKNKTYGGPMKGVMLGQVFNKTEDDLRDIATSIKGEKVIEKNKIEKIVKVKTPTYSGYIGTIVEDPAFGDNYKYYNGKSGCLYAKNTQIEIIKYSEEGFYKVKSKYGNCIDYLKPISWE